MVHWRNVHHMHTLAECAPSKRVTLAMLRAPEAACRLQRTEGAAQSAVGEREGRQRGEMRTVAQTHGQGRLPADGETDAQTDGPSSV